MINLAAGFSSRRFTTVLTGVSAVLLCAATFTASAHASSFTNWAATGTNPYGITVDSAGNIYTTNYGSANVSKITPEGVSTPNWAATGTDSYPRGIAVDSAGNIYTANYFSDNVSKITPEGVSTTNWAATGTNPYGITVDSAGNIYTANSGSDNVSKITPSSYPAPPARPAAPSAALGSAGSRAVTVTVAANPLSAANGAPSSYTVTAVQDASKHCTISFLQSSCVVSGLTNGTAYTFTSKAKLVTWQSAASAPSNSVTPLGPPAAPAAPTSLVATPGDGSASIAFTPGSNNGSAITNYQYSTDNGATWTTRSPTSAASPIAITGLNNGTTYQIKLRAINSVGTGAASSAASVTPAATLPPPAPKPAKPAVTWASSVKAKSVTAVITPVAGVTYTLSAKSGRITKKGSCKSVTIKQGKKKLARRSCTIKLAKGKWLASVTPKKGSVSGTVNSKRYTFK